jgi:hypothetical protein
MGESILDHQETALHTHSAAAVLENREGWHIVPKTTSKHIAEICTEL